MIKIEREKIVKRVVEYSTAAHYCSAVPSSERGDAVRRSMLFSKHRVGLISLWIEDAAYAVVSHLSGWISSYSYDTQGLRLSLHERYEDASRWLPVEVERLIALDLWGRISSATDAGEATVCREKYSMLLFSVMSRMLL